jgi:hypothetical protein
MKPKATETKRTGLMDSHITDIETDDPNYLLKQFLRGCVPTVEPEISMAELIHRHGSSDEDTMKGNGDDDE